MTLYFYPTSTGVIQDPLFQFLLVCTTYQYVLTVCTSLFKVNRHYYYRSVFSVYVRLCPLTNQNHSTTQCITFKYVGRFLIGSNNLPRVHEYDLYLSTNGIPYLSLLIDHLHF